MSNGVPAPPEVIGYRRSAVVPGVEVLDAYHSPREWRDVGTGFAVTLLRTWHGNVYYRGQRHAVAPGIAFCNHPGEALVATPQAGPAGSFNVLIVGTGVFREWLSEYQPNALRPHWRAIARPISEQLIAKFRRFLHTFTPDATAMELQSDAAELSESLIRELVSGADEGPVHRGPHIRGTARMRECLNEEGVGIDLNTLARKAGLTRFQALRAFKRRYGLPPHAYQLCLRVSTARGMLIDGAPAADVAVRCGFVDQSHFTRHFKRIAGVTPAQYALSAKGRSSGVFRAGVAVDEDPSAIVSRSDQRGRP
ncbi:MAG TPA: helix-turn-helix transcriptional regulator [Polyangiaceae bacterium]|jgi:AraC-like DNA-binding protein|nr:helix-turn-helix transcriptional regulator [Polyangiaceae bacterium]